MNKKSIFISLLLFLFALAVTLIDAFVHPGYFTKIPVKIFFFLACPIFYFIIHREDFTDFKSLFTFRKNGLLMSFLLAVGVYSVILGGFFLTRSFFDYSRVTESLSSNMGITADNFLYVFVYIAVLNSFLEEFFFRGFGFITLKKYSSRTFAYIFSPVIFAFYHAGMMLGMFDIGLLILLFAGLIIGGCIFNFLNEKTDNIYPSWFVHMAANLAINTVGCILFGII